MQEYTANSYHLIKLIVKWKIQFILITLVAIVLATLFSSEWFMHAKYKSFAIVYPSNIKPYSTESETEQMLQLFRSTDVRNQVIRKLHLSEHYKIDTTSQLGIASLIAVYEANVEINRTQFESIEISVLDTDPLMAANMVNEIIVAMNLKARRLQREKTQEVQLVIKDQLHLKKQNVDSLTHILHDLRVKYQLFDYTMQAKEVTKSYLKAVGNGGRNLKEIDVMMRNLEEKGGEYYETQKTLDVLLKSYNKTQLEYDNVVKDLTKELTYANVVSKPAPSFKKAYPVRWLIVLASVASANLFLFVLLILLDRKNK
jgi:hypothetical protein